MGKYHRGDVGVMEMLRMLMGMVAIQLCLFMGTQNLHLKFVHFVVHELCFNENWFP